MQLQHQQQQLTRRRRWAQRRTKQKRNNNTRPFCTPTPTRSVCVRACVYTFACQRIGGPGEPATLPLRRQRAVVPQHSKATDVCVAASSKQPAVQSKQNSHQQQTTRNQKPNSSQFQISRYIRARDCAALTVREPKSNRASVRERKRERSIAS